MVDPIGAVLGVFAPTRALRRVQARYRLQVATEALERRGYDGARPTSRWGKWFGGRGSANAEIAPVQERLRNRVRDLVRNDPYAHRAKTVLVSNLIGTGFVMRSATGDKPLDDKIDALFARYSKVADAEGDLDLDGMMALAVGAMVESGDVILRRRWRRTADGLPVPMQIQVIEADYLDRQFDGIGVDGLTWRMGIGFDGIDRRKAYRLFRSHPGDAWPMTGGSFESTIVPAADVIHLFRKDRPGQIAGATWFAPSIGKLRDSGDYFESAQVKKRTESLFGVAITSAEAGDLLPALSGKTNTGERQSGDPLVEELEPGMVMRLKPGETVTSFAPSAVAGDLDAFMLHALMAASVGIGPTHDQMTGDTRNANFSSLKTAHIQARRLVEQWQWLLLVPKLANPIWAWFIEAAIMAGEINPRPEGYPVEVTPPRHEPIDAKADLEADLLAVSAHAMTWKQFIERWGNSFGPQIAEQRISIDALTRAGLQLPAMPGAAAPEQPTKPPE